MKTRTQVYNGGMPARAAYLHVPFCRHRCGYCNFTVVAGRDDLADRYLEALERELQALGTWRKVDTIFLGGGTPTHLNRPQLARLLALVNEWFPLADDGEFSVEANPCDVLDLSKLDQLENAGANRISLGVQSFDPVKLSLLERDHDAAVISQAVANARQMGFDVSLDLIFGAPGETLAGWQHDLHAALELRPQHLSTYGLTFEKGTNFWNRLSHGELAQADEELERAMYVTGIETLTAAGFEHYEVSNFARAGHRCRHNEAYWLGHEYYAAGPGAARYIDGRRETNHRSTTTWLARVMAGASPVAESETLTLQERARERLVFGLRRLEGHRAGQFVQQTGLHWDDFARAPIAKYLSHGWLELVDDRLRLTRSGLLISDALWPDLLVGDDFTRETRRHGEDGTERNGIAADSTDNTDEAIS